MTASTDDTWSSDLAALLERLSAAQHELLALLATKREMLIARDNQGLASLAERESRLGEELRACHAERERLLAAADAAGLPHDSLAALVKAAPGAAASKLASSVTEARRRAQLIRHECLAQWVAMQRTMLHLSQLLEIIARGGRDQPTYGTGGAAQCSGSLIDQAV